MTSNLLRVITASTIVLALHSSVAMAQTDPVGIRVPAVPQNIEAPAGHLVYLVAHAVGTQNFICLPTGGGVSWRFVGPQATLFLQFRNGTYQQITSHFLSANPAENGIPRPTWQHSFDSSQVWGRVLASSNDSAFVEAGAIPWLLLEAAGAQVGPAGGDVLARTTFIQRLNTSGGIAPTTGCSQSTDIGAMALVPYQADYFFYEASPAR
jgi:hypothetical protein